MNVQPVLLAWICGALVANAANGEVPVSSHQVLASPAKYWRQLLQFAQGDYLLAGRIYRAPDQEYMLRDYVVLGGDTSRISEELRLSSYEEIKEGWYLISCRGIHGGKRDTDWCALAIRDLGVVVLSGKDDALVQALSAPSQNNLLRLAAFAPAVSQSSLTLSLCVGPQYPRSYVCASPFPPGSLGVERVCVGQPGRLLLSVRNEGKERVIISQDLLAEAVFIAVREDGYIERGLNLGKGLTSSSLDLGVRGPRRWVELGSKSGPEDEHLEHVYVFEPRGDPANPYNPATFYFRKAGKYRAFAFLPLMRPKRDEGLACQAFWGNLISNEIEIEVHERPLDVAPKK